MGFTVLLIQSNKRFEREVANTNLLVHYCIAAVLVSVEAKPDGTWEIILKKARADHK